MFWNLHERRRGVFDFAGRLDLLEFCRVAHAQGLRVILRLGQLQPGLAGKRAAAWGAAGDLLP